MLPLFVAPVVSIVRYVDIADDPRLPRWSNRQQHRALRFKHTQVLIDTGMVGTPQAVVK